MINSGFYVFLDRCYTIIDYYTITSCQQILLDFLNQAHELRTCLLVVGRYDTSDQRLLPDRTPRGPYWEGNLFLTEDERALKRRTIQVLVLNYARKRASSRNMRQLCSLFEVRHWLFINTYALHAYVYMALVINTVIKLFSQYLIEKDTNSIEN